MKHYISIILVLIIINAFGQSTIKPEDRQKANAFIVASDWPNAMKAYQAIVDQEPKNANALMRLGQSQSALGKNAEAIISLEESVKSGNTPQAMFYLASAYGKTRNQDKTFEWLDKSLTAGFGQRQTFLNDVNFNEFKKDARYKTIVERFDKAVSPCHFSEASRQFDFWIGEWDVKNTLGATAGKSSIQLMLGECVIYENWTSAKPNEYSGKSLNFYDASSQKWKQTWVDDKGGLLEFIDGVYADGKMVFVTKPNIQNQITRLTFFNMDPNTVRQLFENTTDDGKTWTTTTDLLYHRIK